MPTHELFPYLRVSDGDAAIRWYCAVFSATERMRLTDPSDGRIGHAELELAPGVVLMLSAAYPELGIGAPDGPQGASLHLHVDDADAIFDKAVAAGATPLRPVRDQFHGERGGAFRDPFGHEWLVGHSIEELSPAEMQRRWDEMARGG